MKKELKKIVRTSLGIIILLVGIAGLFLPFLQGIVMIVLGVHLIYPERGEIFVKRGKDFFNEKFRKEKKN